MSVPSALLMDDAPCLVLGGGKVSGPGGIFATLYPPVKLAVPLKVPVT